MAKTPKEKTPRELFFEEIGHSAEDHRTADVHAHEPEKSRWVAAAIRATAGEAQPFAGGTPNYCGWWWCSEADAVQSWDDLRQALAVLRDHGIDPAGVPAAQIAHLFKGLTALADNRDDLEELASGLTKMELTGSAEFHRQQFLAALATPLAHARAAKPDPDNTGPGRKPENHPINRALAEAKELGWRHEHVAAAMLLTGVDRCRWSSLRDRVRQAFRRTEMKLVG